MKMPWSKKQQPEAELNLHTDERASLIKVEDLNVGGIDSKAGRELIQAIAKRDVRIARRIESLAESNAVLVKQNQELMVRTDALETAIAKFIERSQVSEGGELVRRVMKDIDRHAL